MNEKLRDAILLVLIAAFFLAVLGYAAADNKDELTEIQKLKIINSYQKAMLLQAAAGQAQQRFQDSVTAYTHETGEITKSHGWPEATNYEVDVDKNTVTVKKPAPNPLSPGSPPEPAKK